MGSLPVRACHDRGGHGWVQAALTLHKDLPQASCANLSSCADYGASVRDRRSPPDRRSISGRE